MRVPALNNDILRYIVENGYGPGEPLPTIQEISRDMAVSVAKTRESLEIARALGIVEIKPGRGTRVTEYRFEPAVSLSALYAIASEQKNFDHLRQLRNAVEISFWEDAVGLLKPDDLDTLSRLVAAASRQLEHENIQVPTEEHRAFHLKIYSRLCNPFVQGILEAYWLAYEAFGLHLYRDISYHRKVWDYHQRILDAIKAGDIYTGKMLLIEHMNLLNTRKPASNSSTRTSGEQGAVFE